MIKTYRLENLLMSGQIAGEELDDLLQNRDYMGAMYQLRSNRQALLEIASSPVALDVLCNSRLGIDALTIGGNFLDVLFSNETAFRMVAFSDAALSNIKVRSKVGEYYRGKPWTTKSNLPVTLASTCYAPELDLHVGVGTNVCAVSADGGETWEAGTLSGTFNSVCWNPDEQRFVAVGNSRSAVSSDGKIWEVSTTSVILNSVCYGNRQYVAVGSSAICTSSDGKNWVTRDTTAYTWQSVCYAKSRRAYYAVNSKADTNNIGISGDGTTWTFVSFAGTYARIAWAEDIGRLMISGGTTTPNLAVATVDAVGSLSWRAKTIPSSAKNLLSICYAPDFSLFAVLAGTSVITSADHGETWDTALIDVAHTWSDLDWNMSRKRFVCVSSSRSCLTSHHWSD